MLKSELETLLGLNDEDQHSSITCGLTPYNAYNYSEVVTVEYAAKGTYEEFRDAARDEITRRNIKAGLRGPDNEEWIFSGEPGSDTVFLQQWVGDHYCAIKRVGREEMMDWLAAWDEANRERLN